MYPFPHCWVFKLFIIFYHYKYCYDEHPWTWPLLCVLENFSLCKCLGGESWWVQNYVSLTLPEVVSYHLSHVRCLRRHVRLLTNTYCQASHLFLIWWVAKKRELTFLLLCQDKFSLRESKHHLFVLVKWLMPVMQHFGRWGWEDCLRPGVQDWPRQDGEILSLQKINT